jgi:hypothetical protein
MRVISLNASRSSSVLSFAMVGVSFHSVVGPDEGPTGFQVVYDG